MRIGQSVFTRGCLLAIACVLPSQVAQANDMQDLRLLEAAEQLEVVSQKITKAYFYLSRDVRVERAKVDLREGLKDLDQHIVSLSAGVSEEDKKNLVLFLSFTRNEMRETLERPYSKENGALMLDYSESLLEGAESIVRGHEPTHEDEAMFLATDRMTFLLERMTKYYIAFQAGFRDHNSVAQVQAAAKDFEEELAKVNAYEKYPEELRSSLAKLNNYWPVAKRFYLGIEKSELPAVVFISSDYLERSLEQLTKFHLTVLESTG